MRISQYKTIRPSRSMHWLAIASLASLTACSKSDEDDGITETGTEETAVETGNDTGTTVDTGDLIEIEEGTLEFGDLSAGDLIITEFMKDPGTGGEGEWFEILNNTASAVSLKSIVFADQGGSPQRLTIPRHVVIPANSYAILADSDDSSTTGLSEEPLFTYDSAVFSLSNAADEIRIEAGDILVDAVHYDNGIEFPDVPGKSVTLTSTHIDAAANNSGSNWCLGTTPYGSDGKTGTPGATNIDCLNSWDRDGDGQTQTAGDCNDNDATIYTGAVDVPYDGIDQDCSGSDDLDKDNDGEEAKMYQNPNGTWITNADGLDCDDTEFTTNTQAAEVSCDEVDNNCDGRIDEGIDTSEQYETSLNEAAGNAININAWVNNGKTHLESWHDQITLDPTTDTTITFTMYMAYPGDMDAYQFTMDDGYGWDDAACWVTAPAGIDLRMSIREDAEPSVWYTQDKAGTTTTDYDYSELEEVYFYDEVTEDDTGNFTVVVEALSGSSCNKPYKLYCKKKDYH